MPEDSGNPHKLDEQSPQVLVGIPVRDGRLGLRYRECAKRPHQAYVAAADGANP